MPSGFRTLIGFALLFLAGLPAAATDRAAVPMADAIAPDKRVALVLGNGAYEHAPALTNPENDARDIAALLRGIGFDVVSGTNLGKRGMEERIRVFAEKAEGAAVTMFYYAGHGMQVDGRNYLVPTDAVLRTRTALEFETVEADTVLRYMVGRGRVAIALLDACRDNPLSRSFTSTRSTGGRGLAMPATGGGIMIGFATAPGETAADGDGRNSPFATALLKHLATPGVEINQTMTRVRADVSAITGDRQRPWLHSDMTAEFYILPGPTADADSLALATPSSEPAAQTSPDKTKLAAREPSVGETSREGRPVSPSQVFGVFENQKFDLCGFKEFSAVILATKAIAISSRDRNIPGRSFRGFELSLPLETPTKLWDGCVVAASYDAKAGVARIMFSVSDGR